MLYQPLLSPKSPFKAIRSLEMSCSASRVSLRNLEYKDARWVFMALGFFKGFFKDL